MNRRTFLATAAAAGTAGLAGCVSGRPVNGTSSPATDTSRSGRTVSLESVDGFDEEYGATIDVSVPTPTFVGRPGADGAQQATVEVRVTNESAERKEWGLGHRSVFSTVFSEERTYALLTRSREEGHLEPDCWKLREHIAFPAVMRFMELEAGESASRTFDLVTAVDAEGCLPTGSFTFEETYVESIPGEETPTDRVKRPVQFTLRVDRVTP